MSPVTVSMEITGSPVPSVASPNAGPKRSFIRSGIADAIRPFDQVVERAVGKKQRSLVPARRIVGDGVVGLFELGDELGWGVRTIEKSDRSVLQVVHPVAARDGGGMDSVASPHRIMPA